jgi:hypothetical protein
MSLLNKLFKRKSGKEVKVEEKVDSTRCLVNYQMSVRNLDENLFVLRLLFKV